MSHRTRLWIAAGALSALAAGFLLFMAMPTIAGKEVKLPLRPVDPFDPLRGQYLTLGYAINNPSALPGVPKNLQPNQTVYVLLQEDAKGIAAPVRASTEPLLARGSRQTLIRGRFERGRIHYGIEAYFMERGASLDVPLAGAVAVIRVLPDGRASVARLLKDDKPVSFTYRKRSFWQK